MLYAVKGLECCQADLGSWKWRYELLFYDKRSDRFQPEEQMKNCKIKMMLANIHPK